MKRLTFFILLVVPLCLSAYDSTDWNPREYRGYKIWLDCDKRAAVKFEYQVGLDTGDVDRKKFGSYRFDKDLPERCRQKVTDTYNPYLPGFDRGHLVPFNHMDVDVETAIETNFMVNILPQASAMNRGAWFQTELITECFREHYPPLTVIGGPMWGPSSRLLESHGVEVPDYFWKVIFHSEDSIAWIIPNKQIATKNKLDGYLTSIAEIEKRTGSIINAPEQFKNQKQSISWDIGYCEPDNPVGWRK